MYWRIRYWDYFSVCLSVCNARVLCTTENLFQNLLTSPGWPGFRLGCEKNSAKIFATVLTRWLLRRSRDITSSSAVAKRPRDASCLSIVSFNSTKRRVGLESFIIWSRFASVFWFWFHCFSFNFSSVLVYIFHFVPCFFCFFVLPSGVIKYENDN